MIQRQLELPVPGTETFFLWGASPDRQVNAVENKISGQLLD